MPQIAKLCNCLVGEHEECSGKATIGDETTLCSCPCHGSILVKVPLKRHKKETGTLQQKKMVLNLLAGNKR